MAEINIILIEIISLMSFIILIFIYAAISTDTLIIFISLILYLTLLFPFYAIISQLKLVVLELNLEISFFFNSLIFYLIIINLFIGICLFIKSMYIVFFS